MLDKHFKQSLDELASSVVSFTQCSPTCGRMPLPALSLWPGRQPYRPRLVGTVPDSKTQQHQCRLYLGVHLDRTLCYKTHIEKTKMKVNARNNIIRKLVNSKWGCKASTLRPSMLSRPLLLSCRIRLPCVGKVYTRAQAEPGPTRLLQNHLGLPQTNELGQCTLTGRYRPSSHKEDCCLPHGTYTTNDRRQTPTVPSPTSC